MIDRAIAYDIIISRINKGAKKMRIGVFEILVILLVAFVLIGPEEFPKLLAKLGKGIRELKKASLELKDEISDIAEPVNELKKPFEEMAQPLSELQKSVNSGLESLENELKGAGEGLKSLENDSAKGSAAADKGITDTNVQGAVVNESGTKDS